MRTPDLETVKRWYVETLNFRVVAEWDYADEKLRPRGVTIVTEPFVLPAISRKLAFFADPFGNLIELAEVIA